MFGFADVDRGTWDSEARAAYARSLGPGADAVESGRCRGFASATERQADVSVLLEGRPRWAHTGSPAATPADIAAAYRARGRDVLRDLRGAFALALFDERDTTLVLAIDRMGIGTLSWATDGASVVFSTSPSAVARCPGIDGALRDQALYDYFIFHMVPSPDSVFTGVSKLTPATAMIFHGSAATPFRYWVPDFERNGTADARELSEQLRSTLRDAVGTGYDGPATGAFLSGGLDSSTVSGYLKEVAEGPANTFSIGFGVEGYDELAYARIANDRFGCTANEYIVQPDDVVDAIGLVASTYDEPFGNSSAIPAYLCARFARESGMRRLLAGDGGDELFGGNERYARQSVFERYRYLPGPVRNVLRSGVALIDSEHPVKVLRKLRSYVEQASVPLPERFESWNFVYREGAALMFQGEFMDLVDTEAPLRQMSSVFHESCASDLLDKMLYYDWKFTLADNDLRKVCAMCRAGGVEVEFPMLDERLVDLSLRIPSAMKIRNGELRTFYKEALRGFLPDEILTKPKHGFGLPFGVWLKSHSRLAESVYQSLTDLKRRDIVKPVFLDRLIEEHRAGHPGYYGYVIWDLIILEEWLKHHTDSSDAH